MQTQDAHRRLPTISLPYLPIMLHPSSLLVLARRLLAGLELVEVPAADAQVAVVLVHAVVERLDVAGARAGGLALALALVGGLVLLRKVGVLSGLGGGRSAAEEAADCVADGRTDRDTSGSELAFFRLVRLADEIAKGGDDARPSNRAPSCERFSRMCTYAAVLAIWPNNPGPWLAWGACGWGGAWCC